MKPAPPKTTPQPLSVEIEKLRAVVERLEARYLLHLADARPTLTLIEGGRGDG